MQPRFGTHNSYRNAASLPAATTGAHAKAHKQNKPQPFDKERPMLTFTIWLLITTSPITGDVFIDGHFDSLLQCLQVATPEQECVEGAVMRPKENHD